MALANGRRAARYFLESYPDKFKAFDHEFPKIPVLLGFIACINWFNFAMVNYCLSATRIYLSGLFSSRPIA